MPEENIQPGSVSAGSPDQLIQSGPQANGQPAEQVMPNGQQINLEDYVPKAQHEELSKKIGEQGQELGDFRNFFQEVSPLLEKLQARPDLVEAIMEDKISSETASAIMEGKFTLQDATVVKQAQEAVKKEMGTVAFDKATPQDIEALIDKKLSEVKSEVEAKVRKASEEVTSTFTKAEEKNQFMKDVEAFINNTPDFPDYAEAINKYFQDHPDQYDVETVYYAVKGRSQAIAAAAQVQRSDVEGVKGLAANAAGGGSQGGMISDETTIDSLVSPRGNPNIL